jgi:hypothetical protein
VDVDAAAVKGVAPIPDAQLVSAGIAGATPSRGPPSKPEMKCGLQLSSTRGRWITFLSLIWIAIAMLGPRLNADRVPVAQRQGAIHGFLIMRDQDGKEIAVGDEINEVRGSVVHAHTVFHFLDGSLDDEETWYRQGTTFELIRDHHLQKGPSFSKPSDITIDVTKGEVDWVDLSGSGGQPANGKSKSQHMGFPPDLANGMVPLLIQNLPQHAAEWKLAYLAVDTKPRIVTLDIKPDGSDKVLVGVDGREAARFNIHTDIGGIAGVVAPIVGKQPHDFKMWFLGGAAPIFVRMEGQFFEDGPVWTVTLAAPAWPAADQRADQKADQKGE